MRLTPESLRATYAYLISLDPFSRWACVPADAMKFAVTKHRDRYGDYSDGTIDWYGIDCGTLADPRSAQFVHYTEDNSLNWRAGFSVLTFHKGRLLQPEFVQVFDDSAVEFRGQVIKL